MPKTCEKWLGLLDSCIYYAYQACEIYQALSKTVLSKCSFIRPKGFVNIWNDLKAQLVCQTCKKFS